MVRTKQNPFSYLQNIDQINKTSIYLLQGHQIQTYSKVTHLGCVLVECLAGESMGMQVCTKITSKLNVLYRIRKVPFEGRKEAFVYRTY